MQLNELSVSERERITFEFMKEHSQAVENDVRLEDLMNISKKNSATPSNHDSRLSQDGRDEKLRAQMSSMPVLSNYSTLSHQHEDNGASP